jgi:hypothetical protein
MGVTMGVVRPERWEEYGIHLKVCVCEQVRDDQALSPNS